MAQLNPSLSERNPKRYLKENAVVMLLKCQMPVTHEPTRKLVRPDLRLLLFRVSLIPRENVCRTLVGDVEISTNSAH